jgi:hypothetical protein
LIPRSEAKKQNSARNNNCAGEAIKGHQRPEIQFVGFGMVIQMKLMKVIHMMKNIPSKEFQHWMEE